MIIEIEVGGAKQRVNVDDSFKDLTPEQQQKDVEHIAQSLSSSKQKEAAPEQKEKSVEAQLNDIMYPAAGAVAGSTVGGATTAGRIVGGLRNAAKAVDPVAMEQARRIAEKNAVETWGRTQHRVPGMVAEKPGLYFGEPTYALEKQRAYNEIQKMTADPQYHSKVLAEQKPAVAQYAKRVAQENPTMMQKAGRFLGRAPMGAIAGGFTGLGAGMQASDAVNRYNQGDKLGSAISGVGAAGTGLAMIPHPITRVGGTAVGVGAELLNAYIDQLKKNNPFDKLGQQPQQQAKPQQQPQQMAAGGKIKPLSKAQHAMKHFAEGGSTSAPTIMSGQFTAAPSPAPMAPPVPQGMPTQAALQDWQNAGSPSNHNFFGSDTPNGPMPEPQVFTGGYTAPTPEMKPSGPVFENDLEFMANRGLSPNGQPPEPQVFTGGYTAPTPEMKPSGPVFENDLEFMAKRGLSPNGQPPEPQVFTGGYTAPTPQVQPAIPMYGFGNDVRYMDQQPMAMAMANQRSPMQTPMTGVINPNGLRNFNPATNRNPFMPTSMNNRAPMNPFNPGFAAQRPAVMPTQPRLGTMPRPPQTFNSQPINNFRSPMTQQRVASGLSQLPRKPMFRRYDEGGSV